MDWQQFIAPVLTGAFAFGGAWIGVRKDIASLKERLIDTRKAVSHTADRLDRHIESHR